MRTLAGRDGWVFIELAIPKPPEGWSSNGWDGQAPYGWFWQPNLGEGWQINARLPKVEGTPGEVHVSRDLTQMLNVADKEAQKRGDQYIASEMFLLAAAKHLNLSKAALEKAGYLVSRRALAGLSFEVRYRITPEGSAAFIAYTRELQALVIDAHKRPHGANVCLVVKLSGKRS